MARSAPLRLALACAPLDGEVERSPVGSRGNENLMKSTLMLSARWRSAAAQDHPWFRSVGRCHVALLAFALLAVLFAANPRQTGAHAFLKSSDPTANAVLPTAPTGITLQFTEPLERSYSRAQLYDQNGALVEAATSRAGDDDFTMVLDLPAGLPNGTYSVLWRTLSTADGHTAQGYVPFTIGTAADVRTIVVPTGTVASGPPSWLRAVSRWAALLGLAPLVAIWPIWLLVLRPAISPAWQAGPALARRAQHLAAVAVLLAIAGSIFALLVQAAGMTDGGGFGRALADTLTGTRYGRLWQLRIGLFLGFAAVLLACAWWWPRRRRLAAGVALALAAVLPVPFSLISHAAAQPVGRTTAVAFDVLHLLGASLWIGGLFVLAGVLLPTLRDLTPMGRRVVLARALPRFSALALISWAVLGLTGLYSAWLQVGNLEALQSTDYGRTLILKGLLLLPLLALGAVNLLVITRRIQRAMNDPAARVWSRRFAWVVSTEVVLVVLVLLVVGRLIGQPPAREVVTDRAAATTMELEAAGRTATLALAPGTTGMNHFQLDVGGDPLPPNAQALLRVSLPSLKTGEQEIPLDRTTGNTFEWHGSELSIAGDWTLTAIVRQPGAADWTSTKTLTIGTTPDANIPGPAWRFGAAGIGGLVLLVLGLAGMVLAAISDSPPLRRESAGLGTVAFVLGVVLLLQARVDPASATAEVATNNPVARDEASLTRGARAFAANCVVCHGSGAKGDGPGGVGLQPPPADLTSPHSQTHQDIDYYNWIQNGKAGTGMPAFQDKLDDRTTWDLINYVRSLQDAAAAARDVPAPEECNVEPRTIASLQRLAATPAGGAEGARALVTSRGSATPVGNPAEALVVAGVTETIRQFVACSNAQDPLRRLALFSDASIRPSFAKGPSDAFVRLVATPPVSRPQSAWVALAGVADVRVLPDGRVSAAVTLDDPGAHSHAPGAPAAAGTLQTATFVFVQEGGRWLIDEGV